MVHVRHLMLCLRPLTHGYLRTNHVTAVLVESPHLHSPNGMPLPHAHPPGTTVQGPNNHDFSPLFKYFAKSMGFDSTLIEIMYSLGYLFAVVDCFTLHILKLFRPSFEKLATALRKNSLAEAEAVAMADHRALFNVYANYLDEPIRAPSGLSGQEPIRVDEDKDKTCSLALASEATCHGIKDTIHHETLSTAQMPA